MQHARYTAWFAGAALLIVASIAACSSDDGAPAGGSGDGTGAAGSTSDVTASGSATDPGTGAGTGTGTGESASSGDDGGDPTSDGGNADGSATADGGAKKKAGEGPCATGDECETGVCFVDTQSYCSLKCTTANAATVCVAPFSGTCNKKGFCKR